MRFYDIVVAPLGEIRADTAEALRESRSPMSVSFLRMVEVGDFVPLMEKFTRSLFGRLP